MKSESTREGFGRAIMKLGEINSRVVVVDVDLAGSLRVDKFARKHPDRFFEVGVAEQNAAGIAAGLALEGLIPFVTSFACFSPTMNLNVIRQSVCLSLANVKIVGSHGGLMTGADGASHQALEDIALMRSLPGMTVLHPADSKQAEELTILAAKHKGPVYLRLTRAKTAGMKRAKGIKGVKVEGAEVLAEGKDLTILVMGPIITEVLEAVKLARCQADVINAYSVKPLDKKTVLKSATKTGKVLTVEDHSVIGGLGSAVTEFLVQEHPVPIKILGVPDVFGESAREPRELLAKYGLDAEGIAKTIREFV